MIIIINNTIIRYCFRDTHTGATILPTWSAAHIIIRATPNTIDFRRGTQIIFTL